MAQVRDSVHHLIIGKKNTKIYKAEHLPTGKIYAIKEVEAKTLEKLNEYKVSPFLVYENFRKKQCNFSKFKLTPTFFNFTATTFTRRCTTHLESQWFASTWSPARIWSTCSVNENNRIFSGSRRRSKK